MQPHDCTADDTIVVMEIHLTGAGSALHRVAATLHRKNVTIVEFQYTTTGAPRVVAELRLPSNRVQHLVDTLRREVVVIDAAARVSPRDVEEAWTLP